MFGPRDHQNLVNPRKTIRMVTDQPTLSDEDQKLFSIPLSMLGLNVGSRQTIPITIYDPKTSWDT